MEEHSIFESEERTIEEGKTILEMPEHQDNPLITDYKKLHKSYKKLYRQLTRLIKLNDTSQRQLSQLNAQLDSKNYALKDLLDNTGEGFFSFGEDYSVHSSYSKACTTFFQKEIANEHALELMFRDNSQAPQELLDMIFGGMADLSMFLELLPHEITVFNRILTIDYRWIPQTEGEANKMMIILQDVTLERELEAQLRADKEHSEMIIKVALDRDGFIQFLQDLEKIFERLNACFQEPLDQISISELFRHYHTIKGGTATYDLKAVAGKAHKIEDGLAKIREMHSPLTNEHLVWLKRDTEDLHQTLNTSLDHLSGLISQEDIHRNEHFYRIAESKILGLGEQILKKIKDEDFAEVQKAILSLCNQPVGSVLQKYAAAAENLADKLGKEIEVDIIGKEIEVSYQTLEPFLNNLVHLVRNSVDHGLEDSETRADLGKSMTGHIKIQAVEHDDSLQFIIADDGNGIDSEKILKIALSKNVVTPEQAATLSESEKLELIFHPGFSTKEEVTDISGRGVGMDAVKACVNELKGTIEIDTEIGKGTEFAISIPK